MTLVAAFLAAAARHLRGETPAKPLNPAARCTTSPISPNRLKTPSIRKHNPMQNFARSPLATPAALTAAQVDSLDIIFSNEQVQLMAGQLHLKQARLLEVAGYRSAIAQAIAAVDEPAAITPENVVAVLERLAGEIEDEIDAAREDKSRHDERHKARLLCLMPLRVAVSTRLGSLTNERQSCLTRIDALRNASRMGGASAGALRHTALVSAGLTNEQIASLGPSARPTEEQEADLRARMAAIDEECVPLRTFLANASDVTPLAGLGFEALIEARNAAEQVPA